jgi:hypothetical protein
MKRFLATLLGAAAVMLTVSGAAQATIISGSATNEVFDVFGGAAPDYTHSLTTFSDNKQNGSIINKSVNLTAMGGSVNASLSGSAGGFGSGASIGGGKLMLTSGFGAASATFSLSQPAHYFGFDFSTGNVFSGESVTFFGTSGQTLGVFDIATLEKDGSKLNDGSYFANITSNLPIGSVIFNTTGVGGKFVIDNISVSSVPVPAALPLFGAAIAGLGAMNGRRRRKAAKTA